MIKLNKILIANRGEIALRILKTLRQMRIETHVLYADNDAHLPYVKHADYTHSLGKGGLSDTYLNIPKILEICVKQNIDAVHPGYGFLSENSAFAKACNNNGITFIGPSPEAIEAMGNKVEARTLVESLLQPVIKGTTGTINEITALKNSLPYPVIIKAAMGGGGKGMHIVNNASALNDALHAAARQSGNYFGSEEVFVEQYIPDARHIEVQVLGDKHGRIIHLFDRECTIQRRYQKVIEEAPSPTLNSQQREAITSSALSIARGIGYFSAGTIEFLYDNNGQFYFLEMNTRLQVEHPVTEMITGIDIVQKQIEIARGDKLNISQEQVNMQGHAIEARIYAEVPEQGFTPSPGTIAQLCIPEKEGLRFDSGFVAGNTISTDYDPMLGKLIAHSVCRNTATKKLINAINSSFVNGVEHNLPFLKYILKSSGFNKNKLSTNFIESQIDVIIEKLHTEKQTCKQQALTLALMVSKLVSKNYLNVPEIRLYDSSFGYQSLIYQVNKNVYQILQGKNKDMFVLKEFKCNFAHGLLNGNPVSAWYNYNGDTIALVINAWSFEYKTYRARLTVASKQPDTSKNKIIKAPLHGKIIKINVQEHKEIKKGEALLIIESMKMENVVMATADQTIKEILVKPGQQVDTNTVLLTFN